MNPTVLQQWTCEELYLLGELRIQQPTDAHSVLYLVQAMSTSIESFDIGPAKIQALRDLLALRDSLRRLNQQPMVLSTLATLS